MFESFKNQNANTILPGHIKLKNGWWEGGECGR